MKRSEKPRRNANMIPEPDGGAVLASLAIIAVLIVIGALRSSGRFP